MTEDQERQRAAWRYLLSSRAKRETTTEEERMLVLIKAGIFDLPVADQEKIKACAETLRDTVKKCGFTGYMALALVGGEAALTGVLS